MSLSSETGAEMVKTLIAAFVTGLLGYVLAAFRKASKADLHAIEERIDAKFRERQALVIDPLKTRLNTLETRLSDCITARELEAKFEALERRLDDILAMMRGK